MLLCDNIMHMAKVIRKTDMMKSLKGTPLYGAQAHQIEDFAARLSGATRLILDDAVVESACHVVLSRPSSVLEALRLVRVPWPVLWVEWDDQARRNIREIMKISHENGRPHPAKFGFLITADKHGLSGVVEYAWKHSAEQLREGGPRMGAPGMRIRPEEGVNICNRFSAFDFRRLEEPMPVPIDAMDEGMMRRWHGQPRELDALRYINNCGIEGWTPAGVKLMNAVADIIPHALDSFSQSCIGDVEGELLQVMSTLILLNARNGTESRNVEAPAKLNKARVARGVSPLLDHRVVTMRLSPGESKASHGGGAGGLSRPRRSHLVMGHYCVRGKTVYWRRAHHRGGKQNGTMPPKTIKVLA